MNLDGKIYDDIRVRTNGDIFIGVVGPMRCGKSTFIQKFMNGFVLPNMASGTEKIIATDEIPQAGDGKLVMTTQPKFVPSNAVPIFVGKSQMNVRLIDCVGFAIEGGLLSEDGKDRLLTTPWSDKKISFSEAASIGTEKVINQHSTFAIMMTTDGSFGEYERNSYIEAEKLTIKKLVESGKPYVVVLNTANPSDEKTISLCKKMSEEYLAPVIAVDVVNMNNTKIEEIFNEILLQFPITSIDIMTPKWMKVLEADSLIIKEMLINVLDATNNITKIGEFNNNKMLFEESDYFMPILCEKANVANGKLIFNILPKEDLFYKVLSEASGIDLSSDYALLDYVKSLSESKLQYDKIKDALEQVDTFGYGIVYPSNNEISLDEPEFLSKNGKANIKLKASASTLHIMKVDVNSEIVPFMGNEKQSSDMISFLEKEYKEDTQRMWNTNMFGKSLANMVTDDLHTKIYSMPVNTQLKMRKTVSRIVNEGRGGVICILL